MACATGAPIDAATTASSFGSGSFCVVASRVSGADPAIATATGLVDAFLGMVRQRKGERLPAWLEQAEASGTNERARFARTLRTDLAAVRAGLTLRQSNGQTEGQVNRLKVLKRQGYGRAKVDLLRKRVLARS